MGMSSLLVTLDNFWIGGRETFLVANLQLLKADAGTRVALMADSVGGQAHGGIFDEILSLDAMPGSGVGRWLTQGAELIARNRTDMIWAHHYRVLPAWLLAHLDKIPLHVTFHGSLSGPGRIDAPQDALGITLAIHRGGILTAVSREIADQLVALGADERKVLLMPNRVHLPPTTPASSRPIGPVSPLSLVMLTRQQKLGHIREAVRFLHALRRRGYQARLTIFSGLKDIDDGSPKPREGGFLETARRLGRKWALRNPALVPVLPFIRFRSATNEPMKVISDADVVLGMGRVVLEGLAANKPTILIGYERTIGLVTRAKLSTYEEANFSGRGLEGENLDTVVDETIRALSAGQFSGQDIAPLIDIAEAWLETKKIHEMAANQDWNKSCTMAIRRFVDEHLAGGIDETQLVECILGTLSGHERQTYDTLLAFRD